MQKTSLPSAFIERITKDEFIDKQLIDSLDKPVPTSIRFNPLKPATSYSDLSLRNKITWCQHAFHLDVRPLFTLDPLFHGGAYYPQEAGSMILDTVIRQLPLPEEPILLDLCAAPGGKSTLLTSFLNDKGILVSNEIIPNRARILAENMNKWGYNNTIVSNNEPADFAKITSTFDCIVVDAPCSGEGMFRKDEHARSEWSEEAVLACSLRQQTILSTIWDSLKPNGFLVYSTCTFNEEENEKTIQHLLSQFNSKVYPIDAAPFSKGRNDIGYYAFPHLLETEGFYICVVQKLEQSAKAWKNKNRTKSKTLPISTLNVVNASILDDADYVQSTIVVQWQDFLFSLPKKHHELILDLQSVLKIQKMGTEIGTLLKGKIIPNHALAMDAKLSSFFTPIELNKNQALSYLKGDTFQLDGEKGFRLVSYHGIHLGWINHLGNRFNNLYPKEWRIRMKIDTSETT